MLEKAGLERYKSGEFSSCHFCPLIETGEEGYNVVLLFETRHRNFYVGELRELQVPCVGSQPLRELLECLHKSPMLECERPESRVLLLLRIDYGVCWADDSSPRRHATCPLPHSHRIVNDVACGNSLVVALVFAGTVFLLGVELPFYAEVDRHGKQLIGIAAAFGTLAEEVTYLDRFPFAPVYLTLAWDAQFTLKYGTLNTSFMLLEVS